ncbi:MAG: LacI family transcriptional regulator [Treponema sp.]|jgi:LacI family transcriptional regulator|nr:LacI family transcriptional regulator [Treponema sp.]
MSTIKDIAQAAGVSVTTVSNVIHHRKTRVAPQTIERINKIIEMYNYVPNMSARALVSKSSRIIGVINHLFQAQPISFLQDPFHAALLGGIEKTLRERGYYMMIRTVADEDELYSLFNNWNLGGVILTGLFDDSFFTRLLEANKPLVLLDSYIKNDKIINVGLEDYRGGFMAVQHLIDKGHRNIIFAAPPFHKHGVIEERFKGYRSALRKNNIPFSPGNVYRKELTIDEGIALGLELSLRRDITAVFATADILAAGIITGLARGKRRVPRDISIIGFDDVFFNPIITPPLTTIHQNVVEKGTVAAGIMMDCLEGKEPESRNIVLPVSLVERDSVRDIRGSGR